MLKFPNEKINDYLETVDKWWKSLCSSEHQNEVPVQDFSNLLVKKGIVSKHFETTRMVRSSIGDKITAEGTIKMSQF